MGANRCDPHQQAHHDTDERAGTRANARQLVSRIARHDEDAMAELYDRYAAALFGLPLEVPAAG